MKTFRLIWCSLALSLVLPSLGRADANWLSNYSRAQAEAKAANKLLLLDFTGSDWCIWCKRLDAEVLSKPAFAAYAKDNLVLLTVDFPREKPLTPDVRKQNEELAKKYDIQGFPTIVVLNGDGKKVGELGYEEGGAGPFIDRLRKLPH